MAGEPGRRNDPPDCIIRHGAGAYLALLLRLLPGRVLATFALMACVGLTEWIGLVLLIPLLGLAGLDLGGGAASRIADVAAYAISGIGLAPGLVTVLVLYTGIVSARAVLRRWQALAITDVQTRFVRHLRRRLLRAILHARWVFFSRQRASDCVHVLTGQVARVGHATDHLLPLLAQLLVLTIYVLFALALSPVITLMVVVAGLTLLLLLRGEAERAFAVGESTTAAAGRLYGAVIEQLGGLKIARSYAAEERTLAAFDGLEAELVATGMEAQRTFTRARLGFEIGGVLVLGLMVYLSIELVGLAVAEVVLLVYLFGRVVPRFASLQQSYHYFVHALPAFHDVMRLIAACEAQGEPRAAMCAAAIPLRDAVRLRDVSFAYPSTRRPAVSGLTLAIPAHRTTAIVGPSGAGKSTIADLVLGLLSPDTGQVLADGIVIGPATVTAWRQRIGYVHQETFLFHDTIRANLLWARPDASEGELWDALRLASADRFVSRCPDGIDAVIGDRGVLLAGGERQRIALARALLRRPALLVLDEATSALDSENERQIQRAIEQLHGRVTILLITHRLSTIRDADLIHVVDEGRLVESGTWSDLTRMNGRFVQLCQAQRIPVEPRPLPGSLVAASVPS